MSMFSFGMQVVMMIREAEQLWAAAALNTVRKSCRLISSYFLTAEAAKSKSCVPVSCILTVNGQHHARAYIRTLISMAAANRARLSVGKGWSW
jgi:hypothetical protein